MMSSKPSRQPSARRTSDPATLTSTRTDDSPLSNPKSKNKHKNKNNKKTTKTNSKHSPYTIEDYNNQTSKLIERYPFKGNNFFNHKKKSDRIRIWTHNLDVLGNKQPEKIEEELLLINRAEVDLSLIHI